jgi:hypothetical protein
MTRLSGVGLSRKDPLFMRDSQHCVSKLQLSFYNILGARRMAGNRRPIYLECFYCGRRSSSRYNPQTRQFICVFCDATNFLDEVRRRGW